MNQKVFNILILILMCNLCIVQYLDYISNKQIIIIKIVECTEKSIDFMSKSPEEGLEEALRHYGIKYPSIVKAQAILETGHFKSTLCKNNNNLFGLYDSKNKKFFKFNHWTESVKAYINMIEYKHKEGENYYDFLQRIGYAEDPQYINKLKNIVSRYELDC